MKRFLLFLAMVVLAIFCHAQEYSYIKVVNNNLLNNLEIETINDFKKLIQSYKVNEIFYDDKYFIINLSNKYIQFERHGFNNIDDYENGIKNGFQIGSDYYNALHYSISTFDRYLLFKNDYYISAKDQDEANRLKFPVFSSDYIIIRGLYDKNEIEQIKPYLNWIIYLFLNSKITITDRNKISKSDEYLNYIKSINGKYFYIDNSVFQKNRNSFAYALQNYKNTNLNSSAINYYLSKITFDDNLNDFAPNKVIFEEVNLKYKMMENGYSNYDQYIHGITNGFFSYRDYQFSMSMNISKYSEYVTYKEIVDSIDVIISKDKKLNNLDGYLYYEIEKLDKQTSMSMEKFVSIINNKLSKDIILSRYLNNVCSIEEIKKIAQSEIFTKIAIFSIENSIILRK